MAQSVELLLDQDGDDAVRAEWSSLADAGLPSERRSGPSPHHSPHITLFAGNEITVDMDAALSAELAGLALHVHLGAVMFFGPHRGGYVCVHQVVPSLPLLRLQQRVAELCGADAQGQFGPGRWTPHVTVARGVTGRDASSVLELASSSRAAGLVARVTRCRRWDGTARTAWLL